MPANLSKACCDLIETLLIRDSAQRPSMTDVLKIPIVYERIRLMTEEIFLGPIIAEKIRNQLLDLDIRNPADSAKEEEKGGAGEE